MKAGRPSSSKRAGSIYEKQSRTSIDFHTYGHNHSIDVGLVSPDRRMLRASPFRSSSIQECFTPEPQLLKREPKFTEKVNHQNREFVNQATRNSVIE